MDGQVVDDSTQWTIVENDEFPRLFQVQANPKFTGIHQQVLLFEKMNRRIASLHLRSEPNLSPRLQRLQQLHEEHLKDLRKLAETAIASPSAEDTDYLIRFGRAWGAFEEQVRDLNSPEYVTLFPDANDPTDLRLGDNAKELAAEQQAVIVDVYRAKTVVNIVFERREKLRATSQKTSSVKSLYLKELRDIAMVAADSTAGAVHARKRLEAFQDSFVAREAEVVKNQHLRVLGMHCLVFGTALLLPIVFLSFFTKASTSSDSWHPLLILLVMAAASCMGTWLSFSLRKVSITYGDLAGLEEDRLDPVGRVIFVMLLTVVGGLILLSGLFEIKIAEKSLAFAGTGSFDPGQQLIMAVLIGAFAGIAERSLSGLVTKQAEDILGVPVKSKS